MLALLRVVAKSSSSDKKAVCNNTERSRGKMKHLGKTTVKNTAVFLCVAAAAEYIYTE